LFQSRSLSIASRDSYNHTTTTTISTLSLHDALPISMKLRNSVMNEDMISSAELSRAACCNLGESFVTNPSVDVTYSDAATGAKQDRKSTRLNSSHVSISYAVFCLKKKK